MIRINPGEFRHPVEIITTTETKNKGYLPIPTEQTLLKTRAKILNISGKETILSNNVTTSEIKRFYIRYKNIKLTKDCMIKYQENKYNITYVSNIEEKNKYFEIVGELVE